VKDTPSNALRTGWRPIFNDAEKQQLEEFVTRDTRTQRLSWDEICLEMEYAGCPQTVKTVMESLGITGHVPRPKFAICQANWPIQVAWCCDRLG